MTSQTADLLPTENSRSSFYLQVSGGEEKVEAEETYSNRVPVLVHHHDTEEDAELREEEPINIVLDCVAYGRAECEEDDHTNDPKGGAKDDIADGPAVLQRAEDENELRDNVDGHADERPEEVDDP